MCAAREENNKHLIQEIGCMFRVNARFGKGPNTDPGYGPDVPDQIKVKGRLSSHLRI